MRGSATIVVLCLGLVACGGSGQGPSTIPSTPSSTTSPQGQPSGGPNPATGVANYQGRGDGDFLVNSCAANLGINDAGLCNEFPPNCSLPMTLVLGQAANRVSGPLTLGS